MQFVSTVRNNIASVWWFLLVLELVSPTMVHDVDVPDGSVCQPSCTVGHSMCKKGRCVCQTGWLGHDCKLQAGYMESWNDGKFFFRWNYDETYLYGQVRAKTHGWLGLLIGDSGVSDPHRNADSWMFQVKQPNNIVSAVDGWSASKSALVTDTSQDLFNISGYENVEGWTEVSFTRRRLTGDTTQDVQLGTVGAALSVAWAYGLYDDDQAHQQQGVASLEIIGPSRNPVTTPIKMNKPQLVGVTSNTFTLEWLVPQAAWSYRGNEITKFSLNYNFIIHEVPVTSTQKQVYRVTVAAVMNTEYRVKLRAFTVSGGSESDELLVTTSRTNATVPTPPMLSELNTSVSWVHVSWSEPSVAEFHSQLLDFRAGIRYSDNRTRQEWQWVNTTQYRNVTVNQTSSIVTYSQVPTNTTVSRNMTVNCTVETAPPLCSGVECFSPSVIGECCTMGNSTAHHLLTNVSGVHASQPVNISVSVLCVYNTTEAVPMNKSSVSQQHNEVTTLQAYYEPELRLVTVGNWMFQTLTDREWNFTNLNANTTYDVIVEARNTLGYSNSSNMIVAQTKAYPNCANGCSGHGVCVKGLCQCHDGWLEHDCSVKFTQLAWIDDSLLHEIKWAFNDTHIAVQLRFATTGWFGLIVGYNDTSGMSYGDAWIGWVYDDDFLYNPGQLVMTDRYSVGEEIFPTVDPIQNLAHIRGFQSGNFTQVSFVRRLHTTDASRDRDIVPGPMNCSWAVGSEDFLFQHGSSKLDRGKRQIDFLRTLSEPSIPLNVRVLRRFQDGLLIGWDHPLSSGSSTISNYTVQVSPFVSHDQQPTAFTTVAQLNAFKYRITGLANTTKYWIRMNAMNNHRVSNWTVPVDFETSDVNSPQFIDCPVELNTTTDDSLSFGGRRVVFPTIHAFDVEDKNMSTPLSISSEPAGFTNGSTFRTGNTIVHVTFEDTSNNPSVCTFVVSVFDVDPPIVHNCPSSRVVESDRFGPPGGSVIKWTPSNAVDINDGPNLVPVTTTAPQGGLVSGARFPIGITAVNEIFTDAAGNQGICSFNVTVVDVYAPRIVECPFDVRGASSEVSVGYAGSTMTWVKPTAEDNADGKNVTYSITTRPRTNLTSGDVFPVGVSHVSYTFSDSVGLSAFCNFTVTVYDVQAPVVMNCSSSVVVHVDNTTYGGARINYTVPRAVDGHDGLLAPVYVSPVNVTSDYVFPVGVTEVVYGWRDSSDKVSTCAFSVHVIDDEHPSITQCPHSFFQETRVVNVSRVRYVMKDIPTVVFPTNNGDACEGVINASYAQQSPCYTSILNYGVLHHSPCVTGSTTVNVSESVVNATCDLDAANQSSYVNVITSQPVVAIVSVGTVTRTYVETTVNISVATNSSNVTTCTNTTLQRTIVRTNVSIWSNDTCVIRTTGVRTNETQCRLDFALFECSVEVDAVANYSMIVVETNNVSETVQVPVARIFNVSTNVIYADSMKPMYWAPPKAFDGIDGNMHHYVLTSEPSGFHLGSKFPAGTTQLRYTYTDTCGNAVSCDFNVTSRSTLPPKVYGCPTDNITVYADPTEPNSHLGVIVRWQIVAVDAYDTKVTNTTISTFPQSGLSSGSHFPVGVTNVVVTFADEFHNENTCSFHVIVHDVIHITGCDSLIAYTQDMNMTWAKQGCASLSIRLRDVPKPKMTAVIGNVSVATVGVDPNSHCFGISTSTSTAIKYVGSAPFAQDAECIVNVRVVDNVPPRYKSCPGNVVRDVLQSQIGVSVVFDEPFGYDDVSTPQNIYISYHTSRDTQSVKFRSGSLYPVGVSLIVFTIRDEVGNVNETCRFTITVNDHWKPDVVCAPSVATLPKTDSHPLIASTLVTWQNAPSATDSGVGDSVQLTPTIVSSATAGLYNGAMFPIGVTSMNYTFFDMQSNSDSCVFNVNINDETAPVLLGCPPSGTITRTTNNATGMIVTWALEARDDIDMHPQVVSTPLNGTLFGVGSTLVRVKAVDSSSNESPECTFNVIVELVGASNYQIHHWQQDIITTNVHVSYLPPSMSRLSPSATIAPVRFGPLAPYPLGAHKISYRFTDDTMVMYCNFTVFVYTRAAPTFSQVCPQDRVFQKSSTSESETYSWPRPSVNSSSNVRTFIFVNNAVTELLQPGVATQDTRTFSYGDNVVRYFFTDEYYNTATCEFKVTLSVNDARNSFCTCPPSQQLQLDGATNVRVSWDHPQRCSEWLPVRAYQSTHVPNSYFSMGTTHVLYAYDKSPWGGNVYCTFNITVVDVTKPSIVQCPPSFSERGAYLQNTSRPITWARALALDRETLETINGSSEYHVGDYLPVRSTKILTVFVDSSNNTAQCTHIANIIDVDPPALLFCPESFTVVVSKSHMNQSNVTVVTWPLPYAYDIVNGAINVSTVNGSDDFGHQPGGLYYVGVTDIVYSLRDHANNSVMCVFSVNVVGGIKPTIRWCPNDIEVAADESIRCRAAARVSWQEPQVLDHSLRSPFRHTVATVPTAGLTSGSVFPLGTTVVNHTFCDEFGVCNWCSFSVSVVDRSPPEITYCTANYTDVLAFNSNVTTASWIQPKAFEVTTWMVLNVTIRDDNGAVTHGARSVFTKGRYWIVYSFVDGVGNTNNCSFLYVVEDRTSPRINCRTYQTVYTSTNGTEALVTYPMATAVDNVDGVVVAHNMTTSWPPYIQSGTIFPVGEYVITTYFRDSSNNENACPMQLSVLGLDVRAPVLQFCPNDIVVELPPNKPEIQVTWPLPYARDGVDGVLYQSSVKTVPDCGGCGSGSFFTNQSILFVLTFIDESGNAASCNFSVVAIDVSPPIVHNCPANGSISVVLPTNEKQTSQVVSWTPIEGVDNLDGLVAPIISVLGPGNTDLTGLMQRGSIFHLNEKVTFTYNFTDYHQNFAVCKFSVLIEYPQCPHFCSGRGTCVRGMCRCDANMLGVGCQVLSDLEYSSADGNWNLRWSYDTTQEMIYFQMEARTAGWMGLILGYQTEPFDDGMTGGDTYMVYVDSGVPHCDDRYSVGIITPVVDTQQDLLNCVGDYFLAEGVTRVNFERRFDTKDGVNDVVFQTNLNGSIATLPPVAAPTYAPTPGPTVEGYTYPPTPIPTGMPSTSPTKSPTTQPTTSPSLTPSSAPSSAPSVAPSQAPSHSPTPSPTLAPRANQSCTIVVRCVNTTLHLNTSSVKSVALVTLNISQVHPLVDGGCSTHEGYNATNVTECVSCNRTTAGLYTNVSGETWMCSKSAYLVMTNSSCVTTTTTTWSNNTNCTSNPSEPCACGNNATTCDIATNHTTTVCRRCAPHSVCSIYTCALQWVCNDHTVAYSNVSGVYNVKSVPPLHEFTVMSHTRSLLEVPPVKHASTRHHYRTRDVTISSITASWAYNDESISLDEQHTHRGSITNGLTILAPIGPPARVNVEIDEVKPTQFRVSWSRPQYEGSSPVLNYTLHVYNDTVVPPAWQPEMEANVREHIVTHLKPLTTYSVRVRANNDRGSGLWSTVSESTLEASFNATVGVPRPPRMIQQGTVSMTLLWNVLDALRDGGPILSKSPFRLDMLGPSGVWSSATVTWFDVPTANGSAVITGLKPATNYTYRLQFRTKCCTSDFSAFVSYFTAELPIVQCPRDCSGNGVCTNGVCRCFDTHIGVDCSLRLGQVVSLGDLHTMRWSVDFRYLYVELVFNNRGRPLSWISLMIGSSDGMTNGDAWVFWLIENEDSSVSVRAVDMWSSALSPGVRPFADPDGRNDLLDVTGRWNGSNTIVTFSRRLDLSEHMGPSAYDHDVDRGLVSTSWAMGQSVTSDRFNMHGPSQSTDRGRLLVDYYSGFVVFIPPIPIGMMWPFFTYLFVMSVIGFFIQLRRDIKFGPFVQRLLHSRIGSLPRPHWIDDLTFDFRRYVLDLSWMEAMVVCGYGLALIVFLTTAEQYYVAAFRSYRLVLGQLSAIHLATAGLPVTRYGLWVTIFGIPFDRALKYHRWIARLTWCYITGHFISVLLLYDSDPAVIFGMYETRSGAGNIYGFVAYCILNVMVCTSMWMVRRGCFEVFEWLHMLYFPLFFFSMMHSFNFATLSGPAVVLWGVDKVIRWRKSLRSVKVVATRVLSLRQQGSENQVKEKSNRFPVVVELTLRMNNFHFQAGQYVWVRIGSVSYSQWHPMSISSPPVHRKAKITEFTLHMLDMGAGSWSNRVAAQARDGRIGQVSIEGPHGNMEFDIHNYRVLVFCAGGIGVSPLFSLFMRVHRMQIRGELPELEACHLIWVGRYPSMFNQWWPYELLTVQNTAGFHVHMYCTAKQRASRKGRKKKKLSRTKRVTQIMARLRERLKGNGDGDDNDDDNNVDTGIKAGSSRSLLPSASSRSLVRSSSRRGSNAIPEIWSPSTARIAEEDEEEVVEMQTLTTFGTSRAHRVKSKPGLPRLHDTDEEDTMVKTSWSQTELPLEKQLEEKRKRNFKTTHSRFDRGALSKDIVGRRDARELALDRQRGFMGSRDDSRPLDAVELVQMSEVNDINFDPSMRPNIRRAHALQRAHPSHFHRLHTVYGYDMLAKYYMGQVCGNDEFVTNPDDRRYVDPQSKISGAMLSGRPDFPSLFDAIHSSTSVSRRASSAIGVAICGPERFVVNVQRECLKRGYHVHKESYLV